MRIDAQPTRRASDEMHRNPDPATHHLSRPRQARIPPPASTVATTGAAQGIGRATAQLFASEGARVVVADLNGKPLGGGTAGPCNIAATSVHEAFTNARAACVAALSSAGRSPEEVVAVCAGVAGATAGRCTHSLRNGQGINTKILFDQRTM